MKLTPFFLFFSFFIIANNTAIAFESQIELNDLLNIEEFKKSLSVDQSDEMSKANHNLTEVKNNERFQKINLEEIKQFYQDKRYKKIISVSEEYLKKYPDDVDIKLYLGLAYYQTQSTEKSIKILRSALTNFPNYLDVRIALINAYSSLEKYPQAQLLINEGLKQKPENKQLLI